MTAPTPLWAMRPEAAAEEEEAGAAVEPAEEPAEPVPLELAGVVWVLAGAEAVPVWVVLATGVVLAAGAEAEALPLAAAELLARENGTESVVVTVPLAVIPAIQQKKGMNIRKIGSRSLAYRTEKLAG